LVCFKAGPVPYGIGPIVFGLGRGDHFFVVGRYQHLLEQLGLARALIRVLDEEFAGVLGENFGGESGRLVASRNTRYYLHLPFPAADFCKKN
jgi:hypothetical protein